MHIFLKVGCQLQNIRVDDMDDMDDVSESMSGGFYLENRCKKGY